MLIEKTMGLEENEPIYSRLLNADYPARDIRHQGTDLQVYKTPLTEQIVHSWKCGLDPNTHKEPYSIFINPTNHRAMYNIPGQYPEKMTRIPLMNRFDRLANELAPEETYAVNEGHFITRRTPLSENIIGEWATDFHIAPDAIKVIYTEGITEGMFIVHLDSNDQSPIGPIEYAEPEEYDGEDNDYIILRTVKQKNGIRNVWDRIAGRSNALAFIENLTQDPNVIVSSIQLFDNDMSEEIFDEDDEAYDELPDEDDTRTVMEELLKE